MEEIMEKYYGVYLSFKDFEEIALNMSKSDAEEKVEIAVQLPDGTLKEMTFEEFFNRMK